MGITNPTNKQNQVYRSYTLQPRTHLLHSTSNQRNNQEQQPTHSWLSGVDILVSNTCPRGKKRKRTTNEQCRASANEKFRPFYSPVIIESTSINRLKFPSYRRRDLLGHQQAAMPASQDL
eukprot:TRINITY_DN2150_c0_g1_i7.p1 TRINITY_DN2150_c0_g1~~TRINITY_DN2150_c0_g1_i7.p1  ORF type:complete len:120 (+),score=7.64 TRINITY_DN2150_c0_g1_i7:47-406(+)